MEDHCKKILLDKKYGLKKIKKILKHYKFDESGNENKVLECVSNNTTIFEKIIDELLNKSGKNEVKKMCETLGMDSNSKVDELKKKISEKLTKNIKNKNIKNKIDFLSFFDKPTLEKILKQHKFTKSGNKDKLVEACARNDFIIKETMTKWKNAKTTSYGHLVEMCETLGVDSKGKKGELLQKIEDCIFKNEIKKYNQNELTVIPTNSSKHSLKSQNNFLQQKIFKLNMDELTEINEISENKLFDYEKHLQILIEKNIDKIFPELEFIDSEFIVNDLRIDSVCFNNQTNSFTIIEYKNIKHMGVMDQGMAYLDSLENNKAEFQILYQNKKGKILENVNLDASKLIIISPEFTTHQSRASYATNDPIELYQIRRFDDGIFTIDKIPNKKK